MKTDNWHEFTPAEMLNPFAAIKTMMDGEKTMISVSRRVETLQHIINRLLTQQQHCVTQAERHALHNKRNHVITQLNALIHSVDQEAIL